MSIYLQILASIQPITSLVKFARSPYTDPPGPAAEAAPRASHRGEVAVGGLVERFDIEPYSDFSAK